MTKSDIITHQNMKSAVKIPSRIRKARRVTVWLDQDVNDLVAKALQPGQTVSYLINSTIRKQCMNSGKRNTGISTGN